MTYDEGFILHSIHAELVGYEFKGMTTAGFVPRLLRHIIESKAKADDPLLLCLSPTRELAVQVENEAHKFGTLVA